MTDTDTFSGFTIACIVLVVICAFVPILFFITITRRLCFDKQLRHYFESANRQIDEEDEVAMADGVNDADDNDIPKVVCSFHDVKYSVPIGNNEEKKILNGVSAYFLPHTVTAIMGPSGCGKSTLLDVIADQKEYGTIGGDIRINGQLRTAIFRKVAAYVMQFDVLYPNLTPRETLFFVTEMCLGKEISAADKYRRVKKTLEDLDLVHVADTRIGAGDSSGGLSGGQKRRVTVAIELVKGPSLIFLDEPTSGLDAYGSLQLVRVLRKLADDGRTIACTIHQPRSDIFALFDNLLLMKLGVTMYFGPVKQIFPYFESLGVEVDYSVNPADFIVDLTRDKTEEEIELELVYKEKSEAGLLDAEELAKKEIDLDSLCDSYQNGVEEWETRKFLYQVYNKTYADMPPSLTPGEEDNGVEQVYVTTFSKQVFTLARRAIVNDIRNPAYLIGNWVLGPVMFLFLGLLYENVDEPNPDLDDISTINAALTTSFSCSINNTNLQSYNPMQSFQSLVGYKNLDFDGPFDPDNCGTQLNNNALINFVQAALYYQFIAGAYFGELHYVAQVFLEKRMFFREHQSRTYSVFAYHTAYYIRMFFAATMKGLFFPALGYFLAKLSFNFESYALFAIFIGGMSACGASMSLLCSSLVPSFQLAQALAVFINIISSSLSGFWIVQEYIGWWLRWFFYINFFRYAFEGSVYSGKLASQSGNTIVVGSVIHNLTFRDLCWLYALIVIIIAFMVQIIAFCATYLLLNGSKTDQNLMASDNPWSSNPFEEDREVLKSNTKDTSSPEEPVQKVGQTKAGILNQWRNAQYMSTKNFAQSTRGLGTLAANNGALTTRAN